VSHDPERESSELEARTRALFEQSVENLDGRTRSRLNQARHAALEELRAVRTQPWRRAWIPLSGAAAAAVLAIWITLSPGGQEGQPNESGVPIDDLELVAESPSLDLLRDVEFYAWIAEGTPEAQNGNTG
jgi:hypothetical protein